METQKLLEGLVTEQAQSLLCNIGYFGNQEPFPAPTMEPYFLEFCHRQGLILPAGLVNNVQYITTTPKGNEFHREYTGTGLYHSLVKMSDGDFNGLSV